MTAPIEAVLFDLDDTLYLQESWLAGAWRAVADAGERRGLDGPVLLRSLTRAASLGSDRGGIIDTALAEIDGPPSAVVPLVDAFRSYRVQSLTPIRGVVDALTRLRIRARIGVVTDGAVELQESKLAALGFGDAFDVVVLSDALGREFRKPCPLPFRLALERLGVDSALAVFVGDRPDKDVAGAMSVGMRAVRVYTGEYRSQPDLPGTWATASDAVAAIELIGRHLHGPNLELPQLEVAPR